MFKELESCVYRSEFRDLGRNLQVLLHPARPVLLPPAPHPFPASHPVLTGAPISSLWQSRPSNRGQEEVRTQKHPEKGQLSTGCGPLAQAHRGLSVALGLAASLLSRSVFCNFMTGLVLLCPPRGPLPSR